MREDAKAIAKHKFKSWRRGFYIFFTLYALSYILCAVMLKTGKLEFLIPLVGRLIARMDGNLASAFLSLLVYIIPIFMLFTAGVTIYAPLMSAVIIIFLGGVSGVQCSLIARQGRIALCFFEVILGNAVGYISIIYAVLTTLCAMRIFTDIPKKEEHVIFEGTLFCGWGFRGIFNPKFVLTYIVFYIFITLLVTAITFLRAVTATIF